MLRVWNDGNFQSRCIHPLDCADAAARRIVEDDGIAIWHPCRAYRVEFSDQKHARRTTVGGNHIQACRVTGIPAEKNDLLPVWRPPWQVRKGRDRGGQLQFLGSIKPAAAQTAFGISLT